MIVPENKTVYSNGRKFKAGDALPSFVNPEVKAKLEKEEKEKFEKVSYGKSKKSNRI